jgi:ubiquinone/menaquinone biosynthesis C-methylase UbiE
MGDLDRLYRVRFSAAEREAKDRIWKALCEGYFQRFIPADAVVLDLACGFGEFSRHIRAARRIAVDLNENVASLLPANVEFHSSPADRLDALGDETVDVCFTSNFFEHLPDKPAMDSVLREVRRVLRPGGLFVAMQPNIRYAGGAYWDYYDHVLPLSHLSAREGFEKNGFVIERLVPRFMPLSTKSAFPQHPVLVRLYLRLPWVWRLLGKQFVIAGRKPLAGSLSE